MKSGWAHPLFIHYCPSLPRGYSANSGQIPDQNWDQDSNGRPNHSKGAGYTLELCTSTDTIPDEADIILAYFFDYARDYHGRLEPPS
jgi:hypothetical protein